MSADDLNARFAEAVRLAQAGQRDEARALLEEIVTVDPDRDMAWLWLATVSADRDERLAFLERALEINPTNATAQTAYQRLTGTAYQSAMPDRAPTAVSARPRTDQSTLSRLNKSRSLMIWSLAVILVFIALGAILVTLILNTQDDDEDQVDLAPILAPTFTPSAVSGSGGAEVLPGPATLAPTQTPRPTITPGPSPTPVTLPPTWTPSMTLTVPPSQTPITWTPRPPSETPTPE